MTINNIYRHYLQQLQQLYSLEEASVITGWIFENKAGLKKTDILKTPAQMVDDDKMKRLTDSLEELMLNKPVQYVLGETWFYKLKLKVNEHVLIPRPETEELVKWIIVDSKKSTHAKELSILDIGTGTGCIAIALKKEIKQTSITAIDVSKDALAMANDNATINEAIIEFRYLDFLDENSWQQLPSFDIIVSNPPYIPQNEKSTLADNVVKFEPQQALFVPDDSPLLFYEKIALFAKSHLNVQGKIYMELHEQYSKQTAELFSEYTNVEIRNDMFGKERMLLATNF
jgi:release factor glutamine methyltransferase